MPTPSDSASIPVANPYSRLRRSPWAGEIIGLLRVPGDAPGWSHLRRRQTSEMLLLTDVPEKAAAFAPADGRWASHLPAPDCDLWRALAPGREAWAVEVEGKFWSRLVIIGNAPRSQFEVLQELPRKVSPIPAPIACLALTGRDFRGQRTRRWIAAPGNLHLSVAFAPHAPAARLGVGMTMLPAVAALDAIRSLSGGGLRAGIKWVNDIFVDGRKVGGVLTATQAQGDRIDLAVLGIGLNLERVPGVEPTPFVPAVGCLRDTAEGEGLTLPGLLGALLESLARRYGTLVTEGPEALLDAYRGASLIIGRRVRIWTESAAREGERGAWPAPSAEGVVREITPDLSLLVEGVAAPVAKGRLAFEETCPDAGPCSGRPAMR